MADRLTIEYVPLDAVEPAPANPHDNDVEYIKALIRQFGFVDGAIHDGRTGRIVGGHGRLKALREMRDAGEPLPERVLAGPDGRWLIACQFGYESRDDAEAAALLAGLNRSTERAKWDDEGLAKLLAEIRESDPALVELAGWTLDEHDKMLAALADDGPGGGDGGDVDQVDPPPAVPRSKPGDLWLLGHHRLLCGDAYDETAHEQILDVGQTVAIVVTDPPYGMDLDPDWTGAEGHLGGRASSGNWYEPVAGDDRPFDPAPLIRLYGSVAEQFWFGPDYYAEAIPGRNDGSWLVWDKRGDTQADGIGSEFELIWSRTRHKRRTLRHQWFGFLAAGGDAADARQRVHPTQKPVGLLTDILRQWGPKEGVVADWFAGSGSTLIAAHRVGLTAVLMELSPAYVDTICRRWQKLAGEKPVLAATGEPHDFDAERADPAT